MRNQGKDEKICILGSLLSFAVSAVLIKLSGFSVDTAVKILGTFIKQAVVQTDGLNTFGSIVVVLNYFLVVALGMVFLVLAFSFLAAYGYKKNEKRFGTVLSLIGGVIFFLLLGFTLASFAAALGVFLAGYTIIPLADAYGQEFKKWISFRTGSNTVSRALFIFNIIVALGIFFATLSALPFYQAEFRSDMKESISASIIARYDVSSLPEGMNQTIFQELVDKQVEASLDAPIFTAYIRWLPIATAVGVWMLLEILRFFLPFAAGGFTHAILKLKN